MSSPPSAPRPVGAGSGRSPCPASMRPSPGEGSPGEAQRTQGCRYKWEGGPQHGALHSGRRDSQTVPPTPLGFGGPAPCELSLKPQTRRKRDPSKTRFSARAGSSAVTGSNQRRGAFSPRRRDPRCKQTQPHGPRRFRCSLPTPPPRSSLGSQRSSPPPNCSGGPHEFVLLQPQLRFLSFLPSLPLRSQPLRDSSPPFQS